MTLRAAPLDEILTSSGFIDDPYPTYRVLRDEHPLYRSEAWGVWVLTRYDDIAAVFRDPSRFSSAGRFNALLEMLPPDEAALLEPIARFGRGAFNIDPPVHTRLRRLLRDAFAPPVIDRLRPRVEAIVQARLDRAEAAGRLDVVRDLALPLPVEVVCELLGVAEDERDGFEEWTTALMDLLASGSVDAGLAQRAADGLTSLSERFAALLDARRRRPADDLLTFLARATDAGELEHDDTPMLAAELMIAGHHTTRDLIANGVLIFAREPEALDGVRRAPALWPSAVEEVLRFESSIQRGWRVVTEDLELHGERIRAGELVFLMLGSANRDPAAFPDADRFDPARAPNRHLAFGYGIHLCVGAPLARLEAPIALAALYERFPRLRPLADDVDWYPSIHIRGPRTLPVALD